MRLTLDSGAQVQNVRMLTKIVELIPEILLGNPPPWQRYGVPQVALLPCLQVQVYCRSFHPRSEVSMDTQTGLRSTYSSNPFLPELEPHRSDHWSRTLTQVLDHFWSNWPLQIKRMEMTQLSDCHSSAPASTINFKDKMLPDIFHLLTGSLTTR